MKQILITLTALLAPLSVCMAADQAAPHGTVPGVTVSQGQSNPQSTSAMPAQVVLVEAESFPQRGGWVVDPQFMDQMGSPYLLAHGLGRPVADATTEVEFPATGTYRVWVRTKDWVAQWKAPGTPGRFQLLVNGKPLDDDLRHRGRAVALAGRRQREHHRAARAAGAARPDRLRGTLRCDPVRTRREVRAAQPRPGNGRVPPDVPRPAGAAGAGGRVRSRRHRRRHRRHVRGALGGPAGVEGRADPGPARARRQQQFRSPRLAAGRAQQGTVAAQSAMSWRNWNSSAAPTTGRATPRSFTRTRRNSPSSAPSRTSGCFSNIAPTRSRPTAA